MNNREDQSLNTINSTECVSGVPCVSSSGVADLDAGGPKLCLVSDRRCARDWESFDRRALAPRYRCRALGQTMT